MRWFFLLLPLYLISHQTDLPLINATFEGEPSALLEGCVHAVTGRFFLSKPDLVTSGVEPIRLYRLYTGLDDENVRDGWEFCPHLYLKERQTLVGKKIQSIELFVREPTGSKLYLEPLVEKKFDHFKLNEKKHLPGMANTSRGEISGRTNLKNLRASYNIKHAVYTVTLGDGLRRIYCKAKEKTKSPGSCKRLFTLYREELPNGNQIHYRYDDHYRPVRIWSTNPKGDKTYAWVDLTYEGTPDENPNFSLMTSDNKTVKYLYKKQHKSNLGFGWKFTLEKVKHPFKQAEKITYASDGWGSSIFEHKSARQQTIKPIYYQQEANSAGETEIYIKREDDPRIGRVRTLMANTGPGGTKAELFTLFYHLEHYNFAKRKMSSFGQSHLCDSVGRTTRYFFDKHLRETQIARDFQGSTIFKETFFWGCGPNTGNLITKTLFDGRNPVLIKDYQYDSAGNVTHEMLMGDITGHPKEPMREHIRPSSDRLSFRYRYNERNLVEHKQLPNGLHIESSYLGATNHVTRQLTRYKDRILRREFYSYNQDNILLEKIVDDGATDDPSDISAVATRRITRYTPCEEAHALNMPATEEQLYYDPVEHGEILLSRRNFTYTKEGRIATIDHYDANGEYRYTLIYHYDKAGNMIYESDALGQVMRRHFDKYGNLLWQESPGGLLTEYHYDDGNRLVSKVDHAYKKNLQAHYIYDTQSRLIQESDHFSNWTSYTYDGMDNIATVTTPLVAGVDGELTLHQTLKRYNIQGKPRAEFDAMGNKTTTTYNIFGQPLKRFYPDGTQETFTYSFDGTLTQHLDVEGRCTRYEHDHLGHLLKKTLYDAEGVFVEEERSTYDAFNCLSRTDVHGITTTFLYDGAGRKIEERRLDLTIRYRYDALGQLAETITSSPGLPDRIRTTQYDLLNRLIYESERDGDGTLYSFVEYDYDALGNRTRVTQYIDGQESTTLSIYDPLGRLIKTIDPKNRATYYHYDETHRNDHGQVVLKKTTTDPKGRQHIEIHDTLGRVILSYKLNEFGQLLQKEESTFDANGRRTSQKSTLIKAGDQSEERLTGWRYDWKGRVTAICEAIGTPSERQTQIAYTPSGLRAQLTKPDGTQITTRYDAKDRPLTIISSDGTIHYEYEYGSYDTPLIIRDLVHNTTTERLLDEKGAIIYEKLGNNLSLTTTYNAYNQITQRTLPDNTTITYTYDPYYLRSVERHGATSYTHIYEKLDLGGTPLRETLIDGTSCRHHYDLIGHEISRHSPHAQEHYLDLDLTDNLLTSTLTIAGDEDHFAYAYDDFDHLIAEAGAHQASYSYDSHHNRIQKNATTYALTPLNELLSTGEAHYTYDLNGNPTSKTDHRGRSTFRYDAYNRLIEAHTPTQHLLFLYDALDRLIIKEKNTESELYLYDGRKEIGAVQNNRFKELRILGLCRRGDIGSAIAIELDGKAYIPIHSITGNLLALIDPITGTLTARTRYSAFGETLSQEGNSPSWGYQSKRYDPDLELYFFGFRAYDPASGRFTTPDPLGFEGIPNLYPFALNNPHLYFDRYGLFTETFIAQYYQKIEKNSEPRHIEPDEHGYPRCQILAFETQAGDLRSSNHDLGLLEHSLFRYTLINGINTSFEESTGHAHYVSKITGGYNVHYTYNATHGLKRDLLEADLGLRGYATEPALLLKEKWEELFSNMPEGGVIRHICHSQGVIHTYNALALLYAEQKSEVAAIIELLAVAPGKSIPLEMASRVEHISSQGFDFVHKIQKYYPARDNFTQPQINFVPKHPTAEFFDHSFRSLTFYDDMTNFLHP